MPVQGLFKLEKLQVHVFKDEKREGNPIDTFEVMFNPESYTVSYRNQFSEEQGIGTGAKKSSFSKSKNAAISLKLIFDGTGVSEHGAVSSLKGKKDVYKEVQKFLKLTTYINGQEHEPNFLVITWGADFTFKCRLEDVTVSYTLFHESGKALRAELDTTFIEDIETSERLKMTDLKSSDLTHRRTVKAYDTLPLLCKEIYGSELYYLQVAKANRLENFRNLVPGQELYFPPLEK